MEKELYESFAVNGKHQVHDFQVPQGFLTGTMDPNEMFIEGYAILKQNDLKVLVGNFQNSRPNGWIMIYELFKWKLQLFNDGEPIGHPIEELCITYPDEYYRKEITYNGCLQNGIRLGYGKLTFKYEHLDN